MVHVGLLHLELFLPLSHSLKDKRSILKPVLHRLRTHHHILAVEEAHQDLWQRAALTLVAAASARLPVEQTFQTVLHDLDENHEEFEVIIHEMEWR